KPLQVTSGAIDIEHVTFRYGSENENKAKAGVLSDISLAIRGGERVGLIGHSGAGKTTLINLMLRLYDVDTGSVRIDGQD
ncbi:ATP-binding cassette domain-containing protein, partial [Ochrobactrum sp. SFR4]|uniref:ATP-binding cassette domain-containing protein n=1 Tax=Ochrobactrum sp. SFR4 TaxID=2717368 RepID=UPI001C8CCB59